MTTNVPTESQMVSAEEQAGNTRLLLDCIDQENQPRTRSWFDLFSSKAMLYFDSAGDYPFPERYGPAHDVLKQAVSEEGSVGFKYETEVHSVYTCGPVVVINKTDIRMRDGHPDKPVPSVGVFVVQGGQIMAWSDYFR